MIATLSVRQIVCDGSILLFWPMLLARTDLLPVLLSTVSCNVKLLLLTSNKTITYSSRGHFKL